MEQVQIPDLRMARSLTRGKLEETPIETKGILLEWAVQSVQFIEEHDMSHS